MRKVTNWKTLKAGKEYNQKLRELDKDNSTRP